MRHDWGQEYILLALRMEKAFPGLVDGHYGPPELKALVNGEQALSALDLVRAYTFTSLLLEWAQ